jgi:ribosomal protein S8
MVNDPIADMLTRIRNGSMVKQKQVVMPSSKIKEEHCQAFWSKKGSSRAMR